METNELQEMWKNIGSDISLKSKEELNTLLTVKTKSIINKFLYVIGISVFVCAGLVIFLAVTALNRKDDLLYITNNLVISVFTVFALFSSLIEWYRMQNNRYNQPLKNWLEERINSITKELTGRFSKLYLFLIPVLNVLIALSIHVYYEEKTYIDVLNNGESVIGLMIGLPIGLFISYLVAKKIRKFYIENLEHLRKLNDLLGN